MKVQGNSEGTREEGLLAAPAVVAPGSGDRGSTPEFLEGRYRVRFATTNELEGVQRLRYEVFQVELGARPGVVAGLDRDGFDEFCDHLVVLEESTGELVGTYRMQTLEMARAGAGLYCAHEFELDALPSRVIEDGVELGRACIAKAHRNGHVLFALWRGLAAYATWQEKRFLFGCSSLSSESPAEGWALLERLERTGQVEREGFAPARAPYLCPRPEGRRRRRRVAVPPLFATYLRYGARVRGGPALDADFRTIDFLTVLDLEAIPPRLRRLFFEGLPERPGSGPERSDTIVAPMATGGASLANGREGRRR